MKRALLAFLVVFVLAGTAAFPQSNVLKRGESGAGLSVGYATNSGVSGLSERVGAGLGGIFDLTFSAGRGKYKQGQSEFADLKTTSFGPELTAPSASPIR